MFGEVRQLRSVALGQDRVLNIYLPDGYRDTTATYPVIYVLDGSANEDFPHIAGLVQYMNMYELLLSLSWWVLPTWVLRATMISRTRQRAIATWCGFPPVAVRPRSSSSWRRRCNPSLFSTIVRTRSARSLGSPQEVY
ncbi:MAG: hypothetical protein IPI41_07700 [Flavobacteriales bacterium]|nr:hypothetical protein [Flavobacteriales bacterium]